MSIGKKIVWSNANQMDQPIIANRAWSTRLLKKDDWPSADVLRQNYSRNVFYSLTFFCFKASIKRFLMAVWNHRKNYSICSNIYIQNKPILKHCSTIIVNQIKSNLLFLEVELASTYYKGIEIRKRIPKAQRLRRLTWHQIYKHNDSQTHTHRHTRTHTRTHTHAHFTLVQTHAHDVCLSQTHKYKEQLTQ